MEKCSFLEGDRQTGEEKSPPPGCAGRWLFDLVRLNHGRLRLIIKERLRLSLNKKGKTLPFQW
jgi:hypothetical protein